MILSFLFTSRWDKGMLTFAFVLSLQSLPELKLHKVILTTQAPLLPVNPTEVFSSSVICEHNTW